MHLFIDLLENRGIIVQYERRGRGISYAQQTNLCIYSYRPSLLACLHKNNDIAHSF